jgi:sarcosine oxidase
LRSYEIFREVEQKTRDKLLEVTGGLVISSQSNDASIVQVPGFFENTLAAARKYGIRHELLSAQDIRTRFPQFNVDDDEIGYYEYEAGFLRPEQCIRSQLALAQALGATVHTNETMQYFEETDQGISIQTDQNTYKAEKLVLSVGPWLPETITQLGSIFKVHRQVLYWFDVCAAFNEFVPGEFPVFIWEIKGADQGIYGFPAIDGPSGGFKIASEDYEGIVTPDSVSRTVSAEETAAMFESKVAPFFPRAKGQCVKSAVCLYTVTPDSAFVIDWLPSSERVIICSPCSGHGFKHSAAIGECIAELVSAGRTKLDLSAFRLGRLLHTSESGF